MWCYNNKRTILRKKNETVSNNSFLREMTAIISAFMRFRGDFKNGMKFYVPKLIYLSEKSNCHSKYICLVAIVTFIDSMPDKQ